MPSLLKIIASGWQEGRERAKQETEAARQAREKRTKEAHPTTRSQI